MIEFGKTLRAAREAKGLTTGQIAERTHMMVQTVEGLENENFSKIVAPIYGRGFVKLYCETVGLDPKPMVDAFMEIYADRHAAEAKSLPPKPAATPAQASTPGPDLVPSKPVGEEPPPSTMSRSVDGIHCLRRLGSRDMKRSSAEYPGRLAGVSS